MAIVNKNLITKGLSGMLGGTLVFRSVGDKTVVATAPSTSKVPTVAQKNQRERFQQAVLYAKSQMADPIIKAEYETHAKGSGAPNAYNIAVADFFNAPDITEIDLSKYLGKKGDTIRIRVTDDFKVESVSVEITNDKGTEKGNAVMQANKLDWLYTVIDDNTSTVGNKIVIKAYDMPGNETKEEQVL
ncbi:MAG: hypothetical protein V4538_03135 [Bacteroidota bacterium]